MAFEFKLPDIGEGIAEGEIVKWLVKVGDAVKADQPVVQVETDKAVVDLPSPKSGTILKINYNQGDVVKVGAVLFVVGESTEKVRAQEVKEVKKEIPKESKKGQSVVGQLPEAPDEIEEKPLAQVMRAPTQSQKILAAPAVRKIASEKNIDLKSIKGSGEEGRILIKDISSSKSEANQVPQQSVPVKMEVSALGYAERIPLKGIRKSIAVNMVKSHTETAPVTMMVDVNFQRIYNIREKVKAQYEKKGTKITFLPFIIKALTSALKEHPLLNSSIEGEEIVLKKFYNIGLAVETEVGLMVPVIKNADHKSVTDLAKEISSLAEKAKKRTIGVEELKGGTFTITNYGSYGGKYATPIINPPEAAILGVGAIFDHTQTEKNKIVTRKILPLSLTFDHRIIDGAQAAQFMKTLILYLEDPSHLLMEID